MVKPKSKMKNKRSLKGVSKTKKLQPSIDPYQLRERAGIDVVKPEEENDCYPELEVPSCSHGKCLLFKQVDKKNPTKVIRWFGCALHRSSTQCPFRCEWKKNSRIEAKSIPSKLIASDRPYLPEKVSLMLKSSKQFYFCKKCIDVFPSEAHFHTVQGPIQQLSDLFKLIPPLQNDSFQAQYWFSSEALQILYESTKLAGIIEYVCVGTPQFFKYLKDQGEKAFLLDIDDRFASFFRNDEFAQYNMMNNEFIRSSKSFMKFLKESKSPVIVCDPPFGCNVKPMIWSLTSLAEKSPIKMNYIFTFPYFTDKHLFQSMPDLKMLDYMVTYENHPKFKHAKKSSVRFFTNLDRQFFILPKPNYKYCKPCNRYVTTSNKHCEKCKDCPSRDGQAVKHCNLCQRCVPSKYQHFQHLNTCSLPQRVSSSLK